MSSINLFLTDVRNKTHYLLTSFRRLADRNSNFETNNLQLYRDFIGYVSDLEQLIINKTNANNTILTSKITVPSIIVSEGQVSHHSWFSWKVSVL